MHRYMPYAGMLLVRGHINFGKKKNLKILTFAEAEVQTHTPTDLNEKKRLC